MGPWGRMDGCKAWVKKGELSGRVLPGASFVLGRKESEAAGALRLARLQTARIASFCTALFSGRRPGPPPLLAPARAPAPSISRSAPRPSLSSPPLAIPPLIRLSAPTRPLPPPVAAAPLARRAGAAGVASTFAARRVVAFLSSGPLPPFAHRVNGGFGRRFFAPLPTSPLASPEGPQRRFRARPGSLVPFAVAAAFGVVTRRLCRVPSVVAPRRETVRKGKPLVGAAGRRRGGGGRLDASSVAAPGARLTSRAQGEIRSAHDRSLDRRTRPRGTEDQLGGRKDGRLWRGRGPRALQHWPRGQWPGAVAAAKNDGPNGFGTLSALCARGIKTLLDELPCLASSPSGLAAGKRPRVSRPPVASSRNRPRSNVLARLVSDPATADLDERRPPLPRLSHQALMQRLGVRRRPRLALTLDPSLLDRLVLFHPQTVVSVVHCRGTRKRGVTNSALSNQPREDILEGEQQQKDRRRGDCRRPRWRGSDGRRSQRHRNSTDALPVNFA